MQQHRFSSRFHTFPPEAGDKVWGVGPKPAESGFTTQVVAGEDLERGADVATDARGKAVKARGDAKVVATTLEPARAGALVRVTFV